MVNFGTISICQQPVHVEIEQDGTFFAVLDGQRIHGMSLNALKGRVKKHFDKRPLAIPCVVIDKSVLDDENVFLIQPAKIISIHSGNFNLILRFDHEPTKLVEFTGRECQILLGNTDIVKLRALAKTSCDASEKLHQFLYGQRLAYEQVVQEAHRKWGFGKSLRG
jgi:hypothetical protein